MDNQATGIMREAIEKEAKWMQRGMKQLEDAGVIPRIEEEGEDAGASGRATGSRKVGLSTMDVERPRQLDRLAGDVELKRTTELSKTLWSSANASYLLRDGEALRSVAKSDYVWDSDELAYMKAQGEFDKASGAPLASRAADRHSRGSQAERLAPAEALPSAGHVHRVRGGRGAAQQPHARCQGQGVVRGVAGEQRGAVEAIGGTHA